MLDVAFSKLAAPKTGAVVLLLAEDEQLSGIAGALNEASGGAILRGLEVAGFKGQKGKTALLFAPVAGLTRVLAYGIGKRADLKDSVLQEAGGSIAAALAAEAQVTIVAEGIPGADAAHIAYGATLRSYRFDRYRTKEKLEDKPKLAGIAVQVADATKARAAFVPLKAVAEGIFLSRDLVSEPANILTPTVMAERCKELTKLGVKVEILGPKEMTKLGFGALMGVAQGSVQEPRMVVMQWNGAGTRRARKPLVFVGKGVTFDSGGISIKPAAGMEDMKWDMAGAGAVIGLMAALAGRKAKTDVVGIVGLVENMVSGNAQRPGDVVTSYSGQTIEVLNTDAEGRLVLADVLWYAQEKFDPAFMVNLATLTGAIIVALGQEHAGLFSNDDELAQKLLAAGLETDEKLWRMPLGEAYDRAIKSDIADMKNIGGRYGSAVIAAQFIQRFVNDKPWAHLDIAGTAWSGKDTAITPKGATAYGVRLLDQLVRAHYES
ncbi:leucyl aminopeptidase [Acidisoma silvae]|uniref:Probable cytosol aminopeptidase n=1 Tax=Acidisoma silvae TaxID=2802396 RepID=A0A963YT79_9PROT|nr:leucyl aminopeptidase [Acidisoma silvae]MCB8876649.1 leucyl aminopeptidase [Acidisoma silvae]